MVFLFKHKCDIIIFYLFARPKGSIMVDKDADRKRSDRYKNKKDTDKKPMTWEVRKALQAAAKVAPRTDGQRGLRGD